MTLENKVSELTNQSAIVEREKVELSNSVAHLNNQIKNFQKEHEKLKKLNLLDNNKTTILNEQKTTNEFVKNLQSKEELIKSIKKDFLNLKALLPGDVDIYSRFKMF